MKTEIERRFKNPARYKADIVESTPKVKHAVDIVRPLAEYNGAGLQASDWPITLQVINGRKALRCSWCDGVRKYPGARGMAKPRNPIRECGHKGCGLLLCGHAAVYVPGKGTRCAKHAG